MVVKHQIIVDGLGNMQAAQGIAGALGFFDKDFLGIGGIIAADIEETADFMGLENLENLTAIGAIGLVAGRTQGRGRRLRHPFQIACRFTGQVEEILTYNSRDPMARSVNSGNAFDCTGFQGHPGERLIDDDGGSAALGDENFAFQHIFLNFINASNRDRFIAQWGGPVMFRVEWRRK